METKETVSAVLGQANQKPEAKSKPKIDGKMLAGILSVVSEFYSETIPMPQLQASLAPRIQAVIKGKYLALKKKSAKDKLNGQNTIWHHYIDKNISKGVSQECVKGASEIAVTIGKVK